MNIEVTEHGATQAASNLEHVGERGSDIRSVSEQIRDVYRRSTERRFNTRGLGSWPALTPATVERKGGGGRPMVRSGALLESLTSHAGAAQVDRREPTELRFGTSLPYAVYHDTGTGGEKPRKLVELTPSERRQVTELLERHVAHGEGV